MCTCGVDEAGRGPLAGPVVAAAVILDPQHPISGLRDSKKLSAIRRDQLATQIKQHAYAWSTALCSEAEIDQYNILQASLIAMARAIEQLPLPIHHIVVDGKHCPTPRLASTPVIEGIIGGDDTVPAISAASILAKTTRDALMMRLHQHYPQYAFDKHKGYPTALHRERLAQYGPSPVHRQSFAPVRLLLKS